MTSTAPTWRDASAALAILSGLYLIIQAVVSFGVGGYIAGRTRTASVASRVSEIEHRDGLHGLAAWAVAVVLGTLLAALVGSAALWNLLADFARARFFGASGVTEKRDRIHPMRFPRIRYSLRTLLMATILAVSDIMVWRVWKPWTLRTWPLKSLTQPTMFWEDTNFPMDLCECPFACAVAERRVTVCRAI